MGSAVELRILFFTHSAAPAGAELAMLELAAELGVEHEVHLAFGSQGIALEQAKGLSGVTCHQYGESAGTILSGNVGSQLARGLKLIGQSRDIARVIRAVAPDVVVANSLRAAVVVGPVVKLHRVPFVWHARDRLTRDYLGPFLSLVARAACFWLPTGVVANSRSTLDSLTLRPRALSTVIYSPVRWIDRQPAIADRPWICVHVARIAPWKGQDVFIKAFAEAFPNPAEERAMIVGGALFGEDSYAAALRELVEELGLGDRVEFAGHRDDVPSILATRASVFVHSSVLPEPFGQVVAQGMATGLPVVASEGGGPSELIASGVDGILTPRGDVAALSRALVMLRTSPALADELAQRAKNTAKDRFAPASIAGLYSAFLSRVIGERQ